MKFTELDIPGVYLIEREDRRDERGFFGRTYCCRELADHGLDFEVRQCNLSHNIKAGTLRGMHYQLPPHGETKLVSCARGKIFDCVVDVRPGSPTLHRHVGVVLDAFGPALYVPEGFAHGYLTLVDDTMVQYMVSEFYAPGSEAGLRWDDPALGIAWPEAGKRLVSPKDRAHPLLGT